MVCIYLDFDFCFRPFGIVCLSIEIDKQNKQQKVECCVEDHGSEP